MSNVKEFKDKNYIQISELKADVYQHFSDCQITDKTAIMTYKSKPNDEEKLLDNINLLPKDGSVIDVYVKRVSGYIRVAC